MREFTFRFSEEQAQRIINLLGSKCLYGEVRDVIETMQRQAASQVAAPEERDDKPEVFYDIKATGSAEAK